MDEARGMYDHIDEVGVVLMKSGPDPTSEVEEEPDIIGVSGLVQKMIRRFTELPSHIHDSSINFHAEDNNSIECAADVIRNRKESDNLTDRGELLVSRYIDNTQTSSSLLLCSPNSAVRYTKRCSISPPSLSPVHSALPCQPNVRMTSPRLSRLTQSSKSWSRDDVTRRGVTSELDASEGSLKLNVSANHTSNCLDKPEVRNALPHVTPPREKSDERVLLNGGTSVRTGSSNKPMTGVKPVMGVSGFSGSRGASFLKNVTISNTLANGTNTDSNTAMGVSDTNVHVNGYNKYATNTNSGVNDASIYISAVNGMNTDVSNASTNVRNTNKDMDSNNMHIACMSDKKCDTFVNSRQTITPERHIIPEVISYCLEVSSPADVCATNRLGNGVERFSNSNGVMADGETVNNNGMIVNSGSGSSSSSSGTCVNVSSNSSISNSSISSNSNKSSSSSSSGIVDDISNSLNNSSVSDHIDHTCHTFRNVDSSFGSNTHNDSNSVNSRGLYNNNTKAGSTANSKASNGCYRNNDSLNSCEGSVRNDVSNGDNSSNNGLIINNRSVSNTSNTSNRSFSNNIDNASNGTFQHKTSANAIPSDRVTPSGRIIPSEVVIPDGKPTLTQNFSQLEKPIPQGGAGPLRISASGEEPVPAQDSGEKVSHNGASLAGVTTPNGEILPPGHSSTSAEIGFSVNTELSGIPHPAEVAIARGVVLDLLQNINNSHTDHHSSCDVTSLSSSVVPSTSNSSAYLREADSGVDVPDSSVTSCIKDGNYFLGLLGVETERLRARCAQGEGYLNDVDIPEEARGKVRAAVGKATLLTTKKFQQFETLCRKNISERGEGDVAFSTRDEDLAGFWDLVNIQIDEVDKLFNELNQLHQRSWVENHVTAATLNEGSNQSPSSDNNNTDTVQITPSKPRNIFTTPSTSRPQKSRGPSAAPTPSRSVKASGARARTPGVRATQEEARKRLMEAKQANKQRRVTANALDDDIQIFIS